MYWHEFLSPGSPSEHDCASAQLSALPRFAFDLPPWRRSRMEERQVCRLPRTSERRTALRASELPAGGETEKPPPYQKVDGQNHASRSYMAARYSLSWQAERYTRPYLNALAKRKAFWLAVVSVSAGISLPGILRWTYLP